MLDREYYTMMPDFKHPLLQWDNPALHDDTVPSNIYSEEAFYVDKPLPFTLSRRNRLSRLADIMFMPSPVLRSRIADPIRSMNLFNTQLVPAQIRDKKNRLHDNYFFWHIFNHIKCVDMKKSDVTGLSATSTDLCTLSLDEEVIKKIPLAERLVFELHETNSMLIFHEKIVDFFKQADATGAVFYSLDEWHDGILFDD